MMIYIESKSGKGFGISNDEDLLFMIVKIVRNFLFEYANLK